MSVPNLLKTRRLFCEQEKGVRTSEGGLSTGQCGKRLTDVFWFHLEDRKMANWRSREDVETCNALPF